jgi:bifunctional pyridoxal-dependent enzyme with beta-cystathionase and maltose regulon repressor activities
MIGILEISWDFKGQTNFCNCDKLSDVYYNYRNWEGHQPGMQNFEEENNQYIIDAYNMMNLLKNPIKKISLCNPHYRYGGI